MSVPNNIKYFVSSLNYFEERLVCFMERVFKKINKRRTPSKLQAGEATEPRGQEKTISISKVGIYIMNKKIMTLYLSG